MLNKLTGIAFITAFAATLTGCISMREITNQDTPLPADFRNRIIYKDSAAARGNLSDFVGHIVEIELNTSNPTKSLERYVLEDFKPPVVAVEPAVGALYESKVSKSFKTEQKLSYFAALDVAVAGDQMLEIIVYDMAVVSLESKHIDLAKLKDFMKELGPKKPGHLRCFVQGARVAAVNYKLYKTVKGAVKAAFGDTFKSGNEIFSSNSVHTHDYKVSIDCIDLDAVSSMLGGQQLAAGDYDEALRAVMDKPEKYAPQQSVLLQGTL